MIENDYISERANILLEFDIPITAIKKIERIVPSNISSENFVSYIQNNKKLISQQLSLYELERIEKEIL